MGKIEYNTYREKERMQDRQKNSKRVQTEKQEKTRTRTAATIRIKAPVIMYVTWQK